MKMKNGALLNFHNAVKVTTQQKSNIPTLQHFNIPGKKTNPPPYTSLGYCESDSQAVDQKSVLI